MGLSRKTLRTATSGRPHKTNHEAGSGVHMSNSCIIYSPALDRSGYLILSRRHSVYTLFLQTIIFLVHSNILCLFDCAKEVSVNLHNIICQFALKKDLYFSIYLVYF